jgi:hypothetical protein
MGPIRNDRGGPQPKDLADVDGWKHDPEPVSQLDILAKGIKAML